MTHSLEPGAQTQDLVSEIRRRVDSACEEMAKFRDGLAKYESLGCTAGPFEDLGFAMDAVHKLAALSRPLPDPELREKIAAMVRRNYDSFNLSAKFDLTIEDICNAAADEILALVLGVDGSAETGKL